MDRKTFLIKALGQAIDLVFRPAARWGRAEEPRSAEPTAEDRNTLYRMAMGLGIDPASMDLQRLSDIVSERSGDRPGAVNPSTGKGGGGTPGGGAPSSTRSDG